jgi:SagB-type dehydrogenase family enzyme
MKLTKDSSTQSWREYQIGTELYAAHMYHNKKPKVIPAPETRQYWYPNNQEVSEVALPPVTFEQVLRKRRSTRSFTDRPFRYEVLTQLVGCAYGSTSRTGTMRVLASPSAGALYPIDLHIILLNTSDAQPGHYYYNHFSGHMELIREGRFLEDIVATQVHENRMLVRESAAVLVMSAVFDRTCRKYGDRGYRYVLLDAGHLCQNLWLTATCLGLGFVSIGGFYDRLINQLVGLDDENEACLYMAATGWPKEEDLSAVKNQASLYTENAQDRPTKT